MKVTWQEGGKEIIEMLMLNVKKLDFGSQNSEGKMSQIPFLSQMWQTGQRIQHYNMIGKEEKKNEMK